VRSEISRASKDPLWNFPNYIVFPNYSRDVRARPDVSVLDAASPVQIAMRGRLLRTSVPDNPSLAISSR